MTLRVHNVVEPGSGNPNEARHFHRRPCFIVRDDGANIVVRLVLLHLGVFQLRMFIIDTISVVFA
jgi:hypothetical protein